VRVTKRRNLPVVFNPDEAVAYGAAVQGGILSGEGYEETELACRFEETEATEVPRLQ
jgi:molecular chaperone DnaK (HSP70)